MNNITVAEIMSLLGEKDVVILQMKKEIERLATALAELQKPAEE